MNLTDVSNPDIRGGNSRFASDDSSSVNEERYLEEEVNPEVAFAGIVGQSPAVREVLQLVEMVAASDSTVLLLGEPATQSLSKRCAREEREMIGAALAETRGRVSGPAGAAAKLGIPPSTLESKIRSMNINKYRFKGPLAEVRSPESIQHTFSRTSRIREEIATT